ncbi:MAG TPA: hypothetical protein VFZ53_33390 [Polyangiaceae bacterium]
MPNRTQPKGSLPGFPGPVPGSRPYAFGLFAACALASSACGQDEHTRILDPVQVAMDENVPPIYEDDEMTLYEVKRGVGFPIIAPSADVMASLNETPMDPYGRQPWITLDDVRVQLSWTLTNLDNQDRVVELIIDPWNEFGRYYPGMTLVDAENGEFFPNLSGIDVRYVLEGANEGKGSRRQGTFTYEDLDEMARDFGTVMALIAEPPVGADGESMLPTYVNHAFDTQNRSENDVLVSGWIPSTVAGLTGIDMGIRTTEPARVALEVVVEITDQGTDKVRREGDRDALLPRTETIITIGTTQ